MTNGAVGLGIDRVTLNSSFRTFAVAVHAPAHRQALELLHPLHRFHRPVALLARDARCDMGAMIEMTDPEWAVVSESVRRL